MHAWSGPLLGRGRGGGRMGKVEKWGGRSIMFKQAQMMQR